MGGWEGGGGEEGGGGRRRREERGERREEGGGGGGGRRREEGGGEEGGGSEEVLRAGKEARMVGERYTYPLRAAQKMEKGGCTGDLHSESEQREGW